MDWDQDQHHRDKPKRAKEGLDGQVSWEVMNKNMTIKTADTVLDEMKAKFEEIWLKLVCGKTVGKRQFRLVCNFWLLCYPKKGQENLVDFHSKITGDSVWELERYLNNLRRTHLRKQEVKVWRPLTPERPVGARRALIKVARRGKNGKRIPVHVTEARPGKFDFRGPQLIGFQQDAVPGWATVEEVKSKGWVDEDASWNPDQPELYGPPSEVKRQGKQAINSPDPMEVEEGWAFQEYQFTEHLDSKRVHDIPSPLMVTNTMVMAASVITAKKCLELRATT